MGIDIERNKHNPNYTSGAVREVYWTTTRGRRTNYTFLGYLVKVGSAWLAIYLDRSYGRNEVALGQHKLQRDAVKVITDSAKAAGRI